MLVATRSAGKLREIAPLLAEAGWRAVDLDAAGIAESAAEDLLETAETFEANALAKARYFAARSGLPVLADDSGLMCDALGGAPGVYSKRWSARPELSGAALDAANNAHLLAMLRGAATRRARYRCAAAWVDGATELVVVGETAGRILEVAEGSGGFGYDPLFFSDELGASFGVVSREEKARVSHRGRAIRALLQKVGAGS
ncbi:MAG: non-canonical purine NTP pyrophosphatase [Acidithiobacillus ferriphilus]